MLDRTAAPPFAQVDSIDLAKPVIRQLDNTWVACTFHDGRYAVVVLELIFANGRWWEKSEGYSFFAAKMLAEGTSQHSSTDLSKAFARYGSHLEILPGVDYVTVRLHSLKKYFRASAELLMHMLQDATMPAEEFKTLQRIRIANIHNQLARNNQLANAKFGEALFGSEHPYGRVYTPELVETCTIEGVREEYRSGFFHRPKVILSGDVEDEIAWLSEHLSALPIVKRPPPSPTSTPVAADQFIDKGANQASIRMGARTVDRSHEDILDLSVANRLLGGFFGSRLMKNIREDKGLTYGIYSHIVHFAHASYWVIGSEVSKDDVALAKQEIHKEITKLATEPPSMEEMTLLRNYATGKMLGDLDSPLSLAGLYKPQFLQGMPLDYHDRYLDRLHNITPEEVCAMISTYFQDVDSTTVVVA